MIKSLIAAALGVGEIALIIACAVIIVGAIAAAIIRKVNGKPSCGEDCACCKGCSHCNKKK